MTKYSIDFATLQTFLAVQTSGTGFLSDGRPIILFERQIFHRLTNGQYDETDPDVSAPTPGGYGASGAHQHDRLISAAKLDCNAALLATSWGITQILGISFKMAGAKDISEFVQDQIRSEASQLTYGFQFMEKTGMLQFLVQKDWEQFATRYNGLGNEANYSQIMAAYYKRYSDDPSPSPDIAHAKTGLAKLGYYKGSESDEWNVDFEFALRAFQWRSGIQPPDGLLGTKTMTALADAAAK